MNIDDIKAGDRVFYLVDGSRSTRSATATVTKVDKEANRLHLTRAEVYLWRVEDWDEIGRVLA